MAVAGSANEDVQAIHNLLEEEGDPARSSTFLQSSSLIAPTTRAFAHGLPFGHRYLDISLMMAQSAFLCSCAWLHDSRELGLRLGSAFLGSGDRILLTSVAVWEGLRSIAEVANTRLGKPAFLPVIRAQFGLRAAALGIHCLSWRGTEITDLEQAPKGRVDWIS